MIARRFHVACIVAGALLGLAPLAGADEPPPVTMAPRLHAGALDLLPFDDYQRATFNAKHGTLWYRTQTLQRQVASLRKKVRDLKGKQPDKRKGYEKEIRRLAPQVSALLARITDELSAFGVDGPLVAYMNNAPTGPMRVQRYTQGLALLVPDLSGRQRALFERVVAQLEGMYFVTEAQKERTLLALKQAKLDREQMQDVNRSFARQRQVVEQRFWYLVDLTLDQDQKLWLWKRLPQSQKRKSQANEHLFALSGLTGTQGARLRALQTEIEQEASPDAALVKRINLALSRRDKPLKGPERTQATRERNAAYKRLTELNRFRREATLEILTPAQWEEYLAIPPRLAVNERAGSYQRLLSGWKPSPSQQRAIKALEVAMRTKRREAAKRMALIRRKGSENGPDSPQMMAMEMEMADAKADSYELGRAHVGAILTDVMSPAEVSRWVMGTWGYKR